MATGGRSQGEGRLPPNLEKYKPAHPGLLTADGNVSDELQKIRQQIRADFEAKTLRLKEELTSNIDLGKLDLGDNKEDDLEEYVQPEDNNRTSALTHQQPAAMEGDKLTAGEANKIQDRLAEMEKRKEEMAKMIEEKKKKLQDMKDELEKRKQEETRLKAEVEADAEKFLATKAKKAQIAAEEQKALADMHDAKAAAASRLDRTKKD